MWYVTYLTAVVKTKKGLDSSNYGRQASVIGFVETHTSGFPLTFRKAFWLTQNYIQFLSPFCIQCSALMVGMEEGIWQVDPTGQFWNCHAAVVGRGSNKVRSYLLRQIAEKLTLQGETAKPSNDEEMKTATKAEKEDPAASVSSRDVQSYLSTLSVPEAVALAYQCCMVTAPRPEPSTSTEGLKKQPTDDISEPSERNNDTTSEATAKLKLPSAAPVLPDESTGSPRRLVAFSIQKNSHEKEGQVVRWYSEKDLRAHMSEDVAVP